MIGALELLLMVGRPAPCFFVLFHETRPSERAMVAAESALRRHIRALRKSESRTSAILGTLREIERQIVRSAVRKKRMGFVVRSEENIR
jgi:hypothetical protein